MDNPKNQNTAKSTDQVFPIRKKTSGKGLKKVLVVDDDKQFLEIISGRMSSRNWDPITACDGTDALKKLSQETEFQIIFTDFDMPGMDGLTLAKTIKKTWPCVPIILLTGTCRNVLEKENRLSFIDEVLYKPFSLVEFDKVVMLYSQKKRYLKADN